MQQRNRILGFTLVAMSVALVACSGGDAVSSADSNSEAGFDSGQGQSAYQIQGQYQNPGQLQAQAGTQPMTATQPNEAMPVNTPRNSPPMDGGMPTSTPANAVPPLPQLDTSRMQPAQVVDRNGFPQPMVAAEVQIPNGWQTTGGVSWNDATPCIANQLQIGWTAMGPDSLTAFEVLPGFNWQVAGTEIQMNPCPAAPFRSTREFLEATVQRTRQGARVLEFERLADVEQKMSQQPQANPQAQVRHDAGRMLIAYSKDGVDMREMLTAAVSFSQVQGNVVAGTAMIYSQRAPNGALDFSLTQRIADTMRPNPQWMEAMKQRSLANLQRHSSEQSNSINDWNNRQMAIINARGQADRHAIRMRTNQEVAGIYNQTVAHTAATSERIHDKTIAGINEVNNYVGVDGGRVTSSIHGGNQVFQDSNNPNNVYSTNAAYPNQPSSHVELQPEP